jgi:hypothetical protein
MVVTLTVLTSCGNNSSVKTGTLNIYQPSTLNLKKGLTVQTVDGYYTPQQDEIWHSDTRFRKLERQIYFPSGK